MPDTIRENATIEHYLLNDMSTKADKYKTMLRKEIKSRTGEDAQLWQEGSIKQAANIMVRLDMIQADLEERGVSYWETGSTGQDSLKAHPLLTQAAQLDRILDSVRQTLGLSYNNMPAKINESTRKGGDEDAYQQYIKTI